MDQMWRSIFTDVGVCYSFNSVDNLFATKTGKNDRTEDIFSHLLHLLPVVSHAKVHLYLRYCSQLQEIAIREISLTTGGGV